MKRMLFNATYQEELRVAAVEGQRLINFDIETSSKEQRRGNIYKGIVTRIEPSLEACFVDYGANKQGFLPFKEIDNSYLPANSRFRDFAKLPEGTELIIQVEKDERGNKGAALTTYVSLPGRYLVLMPNNSRAGGISRRIDGEERDELKSVLSQLEVPNGMSVIARTAALGRVQEDLSWDLNYLLRLWDAIKNAWHNQTGSFLIYQESNLVIRSIRDHFSPDIIEVLIDMEEIYEQAQQFMANVMPNYVDRVKLYRDSIPLFSRFQIEHQIETAYARTVNLPSGGAIVIDHTEALTSVDVNSAKSNKGADIESTALTTNLEAAEEIARQMRLRDLGGLVVVDFIDMDNVRNQREVETFFKQQLSVDRARIQMGKLSKFGLLELSRQRLQASLEESTTISCPRCAGTGVIRGTESIAIHILRIIQEDAIKGNNYISALHVQLPVEVATFLLNEKREDVAAIEKRMKIKIILIPNVNLDSPHYKIKKILYDNYDYAQNKMSYNLVESIDDINQVYNNKDNKTIENLSTNKAIVKHITPVNPAPALKEAESQVSKFFNKSLTFIKSLKQFFTKATLESVSKKPITKSNVKPTTKKSKNYNAKKKPITNETSNKSNNKQRPEYNNKVDKNEFKSDDQKLVNNGNKDDGNNNTRILSTQAVNVGNNTSNNGRAKSTNNGANIRKNDNSVVAAKTVITKDKLDEKPEITTISNLHNQKTLTKRDTLTTHTPSNNKSDLATTMVSDVIVNNSQQTDLKEQNNNLEHNNKDLLIDSKTQHNLAVIDESNIIKKDDNINDNNIIKKKSSSNYVIDISKPILGVEELELFQKDNLKLIATDPSLSAKHEKNNIELEEKLLVEKNQCTRYNDVDHTFVPLPEINYELIETTNFDADYNDNK